MGRLHKHPRSAKGRNMYGLWGAHDIDRLSTATAPGSSLQLQ